MPPQTIDAIKKYPLLLNLYLYLVFLFVIALWINAETKHSIQMQFVTIRMDKNNITTSKSLDPLTPLGTGTIIGNE